jgi:lysophospholipase L1-like esterase
VRIRLATVLVLVVGMTVLSIGVAGAVAPVPHLSGSAAHPRTAYYLALGDSAAMWNGDQSYPDVIVADHLQNHLQLVDMACSGETTSSMISGSTCAPGGSQYQNALAFLRLHRRSMTLVTIDIGGNDVVGCINAEDPTACFTDGLATMQTNLATILAGLRAAAGRRVPIVGMNVYDPLLGDWLAPPGPAKTEATEAIAGLTILNNDMDEVYVAAASPIANVQQAFRVQDLSTMVRSKWGSVPLAVRTACTLLDITCYRGSAEGFGDDPNLAGAVVIAHAFDKVIRI